MFHQESSSWTIVIVWCRFEHCPHRTWVIFWKHLSYLITLLHKHLQFHFHYWIKILISWYGIYCFLKFSPKKKKKREREIFSPTFPRSPTPSRHIASASTGSPLERNLPLWAGGVVFVFLTLLPSKAKSVNPHAGSLTWACVQNRCTYLWTVHLPVSKDLKHQLRNSLNIKQKE